MGRKTTLKDRVRSWKLLAESLYKKPAEHLHKRVVIDGWGDKRPPPERPDKGRNSVPHSKKEKKKFKFKPGDMIVLPKSACEQIYQDELMPSPKEEPNSEKVQVLVADFVNGPKLRSNPLLRMIYTNSVHKHASPGGYVYLGKSDVSEWYTHCIFQDGVQWWCNDGVISHFKKISSVDKSDE